MSISINGFGPAIPEQRPPQGGRLADAAPSRPGPARADDANVSSDRVPSTEGVSAAVDPELWQLLSTEERVFYLRSAATGPLTYGPDAHQQASPSPGSRLGGRIDVRI